MTRQQRWAKAAFEAVSAVKQRNDAERKEYRTLCMKGPALIQQSGLVQALAFLNTRGVVGKQYLNDIGMTYGTDIRDDIKKKSVNITNGETLNKAAREYEFAEYLELTRSAVSVAVWFRRFAQSELGEQ